MRTILGVLVIAAVVVGCGGSAASQAPSAAAAPSASASAAIGGTVTWKDGAPVTTAIDATSDGTAFSGTAVTTFGNGTHTVNVECAKTYDGSWSIGGEVQETTVPGETTGVWSAVIVKDGSPPMIGVWLSGDPVADVTCDQFLSSFDPAELDADAFHPIETGELVPPG